MILRPRYKTPCHHDHDHNSNPYTCSGSKSEVYYHYCVVRSDLPLGVLAAQLTHAAGESVEFGSFMGDLGDTPCEVCTKRPRRSSAFGGCGLCMGHGFYPAPIHAVVLAVRDEDQLLELDYVLDAAGISHRLVREPDAPWNGQAMAIGIEPTKDREKLKPLLRRYSLLGKVI